MKIQIFVEKIGELFNSKLIEIKTLINQEPEDYILNVGETQYIAHLVNDFSIEFPSIDQENATVDLEEIEIIGSIFPSDFDVNPSAYYKVEIISYYVPYSGNINILRFKPTRTNSNTKELEIEEENQSFKLSFLNFKKDATLIDKMYQSKLQSILGNISSLKLDIGEFNKELESFIKATFQQRKQEFLNRHSFLSALSVPVRKKNNTSKTFSVPSPKLRQKIVIKPSVKIQGFSPEPTLDDSNYQTILKIINDVGKNFERMPSVYTEKHEEDLRDHILLVLDPNFEFGSASGETFNKSGKTDIQLRYDSSVVFIAECKFWSGESDFLKTINQLLGYLTFRDSKCSVIIFVRNLKIVPVLESAKSAAQSHPNFVKEVTSVSESWINYIFSLPTDSSKEIKIAVQIYHIP